MSQIKRVEMLCLENDVIGDGYFVMEVAQTLREYADALERMRCIQGCKRTSNQRSYCK